MQTKLIADESAAGQTHGSHGTVRIRVIVMNKAADPDDEGPQAESPSGDPDEDLAEGGRTPLDSYLEKKRFGRQCVVFLVNGQRHHHLDNSFIIRDLGFKYLRNRMMVVVELDGLAPEAITEVVQGSRQGFYHGDIFAAIQERVASVLKSDKDLKRLQAEAEEELSELEAGDEAVKEALDQLIEAHHDSAVSTDAGDDEPGEHGSQSSAKAFGKDKRQDVIVETLDVHQPLASEPVLLFEPAANSIRLTREKSRSVVITCRPIEEWQNREALTWRVEPPIDGLRVEQGESDRGTTLGISFAEPTGMDDEDYPIEATLYAYAKFKGRAETRMVARKLVVTRPRTRPPAPPAPPPVLLPAPTFLRVVSRQPIKLLAGVPTHVRLQWDGMDALAVGAPAEWTFSARCMDLLTFPRMSFSLPRNGRFELLVDAPHGLIPGQRLEFVVQATGPAGRTLSAEFKGVAVEPPPTPEPRKMKTQAPEQTAQRRPPYRLVYVKEKDWAEPTCWGSEWTDAIAGAFVEPTDHAPLTLIVNEDFGLLKKFREHMKDRKLAESTVKTQINRYASHVGFHLYQMYRASLAAEEAEPRGESQPPTEPGQRTEITRVATTLLRLMEVVR